MGMGDHHFTLKLPVFLCGLHLHMLLLDKVCNMDLGPPIMSHFRADFDPAVLLLVWLNLVLLGETGRIGCRSLSPPPPFPLSSDTLLCSTLFAHPCPVALSPTCTLVSD